MHDARCGHTGFRDRVRAYLAVRPEGAPLKEVFEACCPERTRHSEAALESPYNFPGLRKKKVRETRERLANGTFAPGSFWVHITWTAKDEEEDKERVRRSRAEVTAHYKELREKSKAETQQFWAGI